MLDLQPDAITFWKSVARELSAECTFGSEYSQELSQLTICAPSIIVVDKSICSGEIMDMVSTILHDKPASTVVVTGKEFSTQKIVEMLNQGVRWVFTKELLQNEVRAAMPTILKFSAAAYQEWSEHLSLSSLFAQVSSREISVLQMIMEGIPNKLIAKQLNVSIRTVEARRSKFYRKLKVRSVAELVRVVDRADRLRQRFAAVTVLPNLITKRECSLALKPPSEPLAGHIRDFASEFIA